MRTLILSLLLALCAAPTLAAPAAPAPVEAPASAGVVVAADLRQDYVAGFPMLVRVTVRNDGDAPATFPDLASRPWLVRFLVEGPGGQKSERYTTPPQIDSAATWTLAPRAYRTVLLEIPSSAAFAPGDWKLTVKVTSPSVVLPTTAIRLATADPVGGTPIFEATIAGGFGQLFPWVQKAPGGHQLYLMQYSPGSTRLEGQYYLMALSAAVDPILSRARPQDAKSRWIYWTEGVSIRLARLDGTQLRGDPRSIAIPWPKMEWLGRGVTDATGGAQLPVWVPAPSGAGGSVKVIQVDARGNFLVRAVADLSTRPTVLATTADATGNLALLLAHAAGLDLYRVDPAADMRFPVKGVRAYKPLAGEDLVAASFATLPDQAGRAGGLAGWALVRTTAADGTATVRRLLVDLGGKVFDTSAPVAWTLPAPVIDTINQGYGGWGVLGRDEKKTLYWQTDVAPAAVVGIPGDKPLAVWTLPDLRVKRLGGATVVGETRLGSD